MTADLDLRALEERTLLPTYRKLPLSLVRGDNDVVWDDRGRAFVDLYGGHAVTLIGHAHPRWVRALAEQAGTLGFYSNVVYSPVRARAARALLDLAPGHLTRVFYCNSGTEANETALKLARKATGRRGVVAMTAGFHGRTLGSLSATGLGHYREGVAPLVEGTRFVPLGDLDALDRALDGEVAAVILEPVQSMAGVVEAPPAYLHALETLAHQRGVLVVLDEIQTGLGRLGAPFAATLHGLSPDLVTLGKGLAGGFPIGAVLVSEALAATVKVEDHGTTFGGGPLACAASLATLEVLRDEGLVERAGRLGAAFREALAGGPAVEVRGRGCLLGVVLPEGHDSAPVRARLLERGFLTGGAADPRVIRLAPPLTVDEGRPAELAAALRAACAGTTPRSTTP